jgi:hypothetical protein
MLSDYSDWIIDLPISNADDLFPSYSDGCDVKASVALFNSILLQRVEETYPVAIVNQVKQSKYYTYGPETAERRQEENILMNLAAIGEKLYEDGDWYVLN